MNAKERITDEYAAWLPKLQNPPEGFPERLNVADLPQLRLFLNDSK